MENNKEFKKPTAEDINEAVRLLLWRCRDARVDNDPKGFYGLNDWISKAMDSEGGPEGFDGKWSSAVLELELFLGDIQKLNIGHSDS